jgi:hypothetical protein
MADYRLSAKIVSRADGKSVIAATAYRSAEKLLDERTGDIKDYTRRFRSVLYTEILTPANAPEQMDDMTRLGSLILKHWTNYRPQMVEELERTNQLHRVLRQAQEQTGDLLYNLAVVQKMDYQAAWELATKEWAFLPEEDPQPSSASQIPNQSQPPRATSG